MDNDSNLNSHIQYFPSNVLAKIFSFLDDEDICNRVPFVCKKWKLASSCLSLNNATFEGGSVSSQDICDFLFGARHLTSIKLVSIDDVIPVLRQICTCNRKVQEIAVEKCTPDGKLIPEEVLVNVLLSLPHLRTISLKGTKFESHLFFRMVALQSNITSIDISWNEHVTLSDLMTLVHNGRIKELKMSRRHRRPEITDMEMAHLINTAKRTLELLHLDMRNLTDHTYGEVFSCTRLTDLKMNNAINFSYGIVSKLPTLMNKLKNLKIEGPTMLLPGDILRLLLHFKLAKQLECLKIEYINSFQNDECCELLKHCPGLKTLSLEGCTSLSAESLSRGLSALTTLNVLNVAFIGQSSAIERVITGLKQLHTLVVDETSYELNDLSAMSLTSQQIKIKKITGKPKVILL